MFKKDYDLTIIENKSTGKNETILSGLTDNVYIIYDDMYYYPWKAAENIRLEYSDILYNSADTAVTYNINFITTEQFNIKQYFDIKKYGDDAKEFYSYVNYKIGFKQENSIFSIISINGDIKYYNKNNFNSDEIKTTINTII